MLFGTGSAKFERSGSTVVLDYSNIRPNWIDKQYNERISIHDHYTSVVFKGDYSDFWIDVNLFKYTQGTDSPTKKFSELYPYLYSYVYFWPHIDGYAISGSDNIPTVFFVKEMQHRYHSDNITTNDILSVHFVSTDYMSVTGSLGVQVDEGDS